MFSDPLSVTYNGSGKSLARVGSTNISTRYRTADGEFEILISKLPAKAPVWLSGTSIELARRLPDPTPADVFDNYRLVRNSFGISYRFDHTKAETSVDVPRLRTALLALVDSTFEGRLIGGEL